jgi:N-acetylglutamate synthase-like GNAT family acetyltransferase
VTTALPRPAVLSAYTSVRRACHDDAPSLYALSRQFFADGALRVRPALRYAADADDYLVAQTAAGDITGCLALRTHRHGRTGTSAVLYNFCVAPGSQGRGIGSALLRAVLARAAADARGAVYTATTGGGALFLRHGFVPVPARYAPPEWAAALDPRRGSVVLARTIARSGGSPHPG